MTLEIETICKAHWALDAIDRSLSSAAHKAGHGLTGVQVRLLMAIGEGIAQSDLDTMERHTGSNVTHNLAKLERACYAVATTVPTDKRRRMLRCTKVGLKIAALGREVLDAAPQQWRAYLMAA